MQVIGIKCYISCRLKLKEENLDEYSWHMFLELFAILVSIFMLRVPCFNAKNVYWKL